MNKEPIIHSHLTDGLPTFHDLADCNVYFDQCEVMVHCGNNECMQTRVEFDGYNLCSRCFKPYLTEVISVYKPTYMKTEENNAITTNNSAA